MKYFNHNSIFFTISVFLFSNSLIGQIVTVTDSYTNNKIVDVDVFNNNKTKYLTTDQYGGVDISIFNSEEIILFKILGYKLKKLKKNEILNNNLIIKLDPEKKELDEIILSVARKSSSRKKIAEKVSVLSLNKINFFKPANSSDLLSLSPDIRIQKSQGGGGSPVLRGFEANRVLLVIDGIRMNNAIYRSGHIHNVNTIDPNIVNRAEVIFGSSSVGYGSDALGGVIHFYTKSPTINNQKKLKTSISQNFNSANKSLLNNLSFEYSFPKWAGISSFSYSKFNDIKSGNKRSHGFPGWGLNNLYFPQDDFFFYEKPIKNLQPSIQKNTGFDQYHFFQKFIFNITNRSQLNLNFQLSNSSNISRYDKLSEIDKNGNFNYAEWYYGPQKRLLFSPQFKFFSNEKLLKKGTITPSYQFINESRINRKFGNLNKSYQIEKLSIYGLNGDFEGSIGSYISFSYGFEFFKNQLISGAYSKKLIIKNSRIINYEKKVPIPSRYPSDGSSYNSNAAYFNLIYDFNTQSTLNFGLRFTSTNLIANWNEDALIDQLLSNFKTNTKALTYTVGYTFRPNDRFKFNSILSSGFRTPNIDDIGKIRENNSILTVPNTFLKPEYAYNFDLGFDYSINKFLNFKIRNYLTLISRHIVRSNYSIFSDTSTEDPLTIIYDGNEVSTIANKNLGNRFIYGSSMNLKLNFSRFLHFESNLTYTNADKSEKYGPMPSILPLFGFSKLEVKFPKFKFLIINEFSSSKKPKDYSFGGEDGIEETPIIKENDSNGLSYTRYYGTPKWNIFSFNANYYINNSFSINFGLENIFDLNYREFASGISSPGRNLLLGLNIKF
tara:strand:- start:25484 stop:27985 length:2502 start_codon:yes stop_codon:yes gene_type:complete